MDKISTVELLDAISLVVPHKEVNNLEEPQETKGTVPVEETVNPLHCLLEMLVSKLPLMVSNNFSLSVVPLRMLELLKMKKADLRVLLMLSLKPQKLLRKLLN